MPMLYNVCLLILLSDTHRSIPSDLGVCLDLELQVRRLECHLYVL